MLLRILACELGSKAVLYRSDDDFEDQVACFDGEHAYGFLIDGMKGSSSNEASELAWKLQWYTFLNPAIVSSFRLIINLALKLR